MRNFRAPFIKLKLATIFLSEGLHSTLSNFRIFSNKKILRNVSELIQHVLVRKDFDQVKVYFVYTIIINYRGTLTFIVVYNNLVMLFARKHVWENPVGTKKKIFDSMSVISHSKMSTVFTNSNTRSIF